MTRPRQAHRIQTQVVHGGTPHPRIEGAVVTPIFQSAMFEYGAETSYDDLKYIRMNNTPNQVLLGQRLALLEGAQAGLVTGSGMAAISASLLSVCKAGDHMLAQSCLYGGTHSLLTEDFTALGIEVDFIDVRDPGSWQTKLRPRTRAVYVEAMSNPLLEVADHASIVRFANEHSLTSLIDNTFASPINFQAVAFGYDLSLHSCTKYLNGHSDIVAGCVMGSQESITKVIHKLNHLGGSLDPHACFLLERGIKTLALRVREQNHNTLALAQFLSQHPAVHKVNYPGLETHPDYSNARQWFQGFGGVLSFEPTGGVTAAERFINQVKLALRAPSLGGVETLVSRPAAASHLGVPRDERLRIGITDELVRIAVGIEAVEDLLEDVSQALG
jgi:cystathionine beta-lyase/cystathionine gamma-synthase